ncbi:RNA polymerase III C11 subunit, partial [Recurvomyces mirabilis]
MLLFCPSCSNMLIISRIPSSHTAPDEDTNANKTRFECRTCPYQMVLDRRYYERKEMSLKTPEDVLGGADSWKNVDRAQSKQYLLLEAHLLLLLSISPTLLPSLRSATGNIISYRDAMNHSAGFPAESRHTTPPFPTPAVTPSKPFHTYRTYNPKARCKRDICPSQSAYFRQVQIRSADEPMTTFYR